MCCILNRYLKGFCYYQCIQCICQCIGSIKHHFLEILSNQDRGTSHWLLKNFFYHKLNFHLCWSIQCRNLDNINNVCTMRCKKRHCLSKFHCWNQNFFLQGNCNSCYFGYNLHYFHMRYDKSNKYYQLNYKKQRA